MAVAAGLALLVAALIGDTATGPAGAKTKAKAKNPLAGSWVGMTAATNTYSGAPAPVSYRITNGGKVVDFSTTVTLDKTPGGGPCQTPVEVTFTMPPVKMDTPSPTYPKGKRFSFSGTGGNPPGQGEANGKTGIGSAQGATGFQGFRKMEGGIIWGVGGSISTPSGPCRTGGVYWSATRPRSAK